MGDIAHCARHKVTQFKDTAATMTALFPQIERPTRLQASRIAMSRGGNVLFEGLSATVSSGDVLWIQGNNGIGKTTLLEAFAGLIRPDAGDMLWYEGDTLNPASQLIAYQPHRSYAKTTMTAREDLMFWSKIYGSEDLVDEAFHYVDLSARQSVPTQNLSAGQRRRLALAKLIISAKPIWIMDEPSAAMDKNGAALIDEMIGQHINRGGSAIIASHDSSRKLSIHTRKLILKTAS